MSGDRKPSISTESAGECYISADSQSIDEEARALISAPKRDSIVIGAPEERGARPRGDRLATMADMAAALVHEVTQPLTAAANYLSAARRLIGGDPNAAAALDKAEAQMVRAGRIIGRLRELTARGEPDAVAQSLHELIRRASEVAAPALRRAGVNLTLRLDAAEDRVVADRIEIEQALVNLIRNAALGGSPQRTVTIATSVADGFIQTEVAGARAGIFESIQAELFDSSKSTEVDGGDGLAIARSIIEAHRGRVSAVSYRVGGMLISFTLPLVEPEQGGG